MTENRILTRERDIPLLLFLWKWKVATTAGLYLKFFSNRTPRRAYNRLWELGRAGFLEQRRDNLAGRSVWSLTRKGFSEIKPCLPALRSDGFRSELVGHDLLVSAIHLGDWFFELPDGVEVFTEQELRRYHFDDYPAWVPQTELHRPDGYWYLSDEPTTIALEVELNNKKGSEYEHVSRFYDYYENISRVIWVVPQRSLIHRIQGRLSTVSQRQIHDFVLYDEFSKYGWRAAFAAGPEQDKTIQSLLRKKAGKSPETFPAHPMLETRRSPHVSMTYKYLSNHQNSDRVHFTP